MKQPRSPHQPIAQEEEGFSLVVVMAIALILARNPLAFQPKVVTTADIDGGALVSPTSVASSSSSSSSSSHKTASDAVTDASGATALTL